MDAIEYFKGMRKRLCEDHLKLLPKKSVGYQTTLREMSFYDAAIKALEQEPCEDWYDVPSDEMTLGQARQAVKDLRKMWAEHLWQEPCEDAISRSDAIRVASGYCHWSNIPKELAKLPSVNAEKTGRWIPVSERLPKKSGRYLTYIVNEHDNKLQYIMTGDYLADRHWFSDDECASDNVVAWMPLPEPYKAESEVEE